MKKLIILILLIFTIDIIPVKASTSSIVMDLDSGRVLYQENIKEKKLIASTTKILTAIVTLENASLNKEVIIGDEVLKMYGTNIYIEVGEKITIKDLLYGLLLRSGNDAAVALAVAVSGSEEEFVKLMNKKAQDIGMKDSSFTNPHGLDDDTKNYSTAYDMALLSRYAYQNKTYRKIVGTKKYVTKTKDKTYLWYNRNKLLSDYKYCTGGKNGYTPLAGKTLVTTASKNNLNLTVVTLNDGDEYTTHKYYYEKVFKNYNNYLLLDKNNFKIDKNFCNKEVYLKESFSYPLTDLEVDKVKTVLSLENKNSKNKIVGNINIYLDKELIGRVDIYQKEKKEQKKSLFQKIKDFFK